MSQLDARAFLGLLERDATLRRTVTDQPGGPSIERLIALGGERGLRFTASELVAAAKEHRPAAAVASGELDDADLDEVAGGTAAADGLKVIHEIIRNLSEMRHQLAALEAQNQRG